MLTHIFDFVPKSAADKELALLLRRALAESGYTQGAAGELLSKHQTWFPNYLFRDPGGTIRRMVAQEPETYDTLVAILKLDYWQVLSLAGIKIPTPDATEVPLKTRILVFEAGAGPALDIDEAVDTVDVPIDNGGSYRVIGLRIHGDSMKPYLEPGDTAFVACEPSLIKPGRAIGIYLPDSGSVVKEYVRTLPSGEILLRSMNSVDEADYFVAPIGARVYGPVVKRLKGG